MFKKYYKKLSLVLVMLFLVGLISPGITLAAGCEITTVMKTIDSDKSDPQDLGTVRITDIKSCDTVWVEISLPEGVEWDIPMTAGTVGDYIYIKDENGNTVNDGVLIDADENRYTVYFDDPVMFEEDAYIKAVFNDIIIKSYAPDEICLDIMVRALEDGLLLWDAQGECSSYSNYDFDVECESSKTVNIGSEQLSGIVEFSEAAIGTFTVGDVFTLTLPDGCEWENAWIENGRYGLEADFGIDGDELEISIIQTASLRDSFSVQGYMKIMPTVPDGDIEAEIDGSLEQLEYDGDSLVIASKGKVSVNITARDTSDDVIYPASYDKELDQIKMTNTGTFEVGSVITMTLSDGLRWYNDWDGLTPYEVDGVDFMNYYDGNQSLWLQVNDSVDEIVFDGLLAAALPDTPEGDIIVEFGGDYSGEVVVGQVAPVASVSAAAVNVNAGEMSQPVGDINIKETGSKSFDAIAGSWYMTLELPAGCCFTGEPQVLINKEEVSTQFYSDTLLTSFEAGDSTLVIVFNSSDFNSSRFDEVTLAGLEYDVDKRTAAGELEVNFSGTMLNKLYLSGNVLIENLEDDYAESPVMSAVNAVVERSGLVESSMTIGGLEMFIDGESLMMDAAPYIKNDRTYLPVRYVAYALGITDSGIIWDGAEQTVTLVKGYTTVQIQIGSTEMIINGEKLTMDTAPEITSSRTMLPVRFIAEAFGASVGWDPVTRTVSLVI